MELTSFFQLHNTAKQISQGCFRRHKPRSIQPFVYYKIVPLVNSTKSKSLSIMDVNEKELKAFLNDYKGLFWYTPEEKKEDLRQDQIVETILNYGDEKAVKRLLDIIGLEQVAAIFKKHVSCTDRRKLNYHPLVAHYFKLYFSRHVPQYTIT